MIIKWNKLLISLLIPLATGGLSALLSGGNMDLFEKIEKPPLSPPGWLFPVVWTILYILMGISLYLVLDTKGAREVKPQLIIFAVQLFFNFFWSLIFFNLNAFLFAFVWLVLLWVLIAANIFLFYSVNKTSAILMIPYFLWVTFAGYLNLSIYYLN